MEARHEEKGRGKLIESPKICNNAASVHDHAVNNRLGMNGVGVCSVTVKLRNSSHHRERKSGDSKSPEIRKAGRLWLMFFRNATTFLVSLAWSISLFRSAPLNPAMDIERLSRVANGRVEYSAVPSKRAS